MGVSCEEGKLFQCQAADERKKKDLAFRILLPILANCAEEKGGGKHLHFVAEVNRTKISVVDVAFPGFP